MKTHSLNLKPYQLSAANEERLGMVCVSVKGDVPEGATFEPMDNGFWEIRTQSGSGRHVQIEYAKSTYAPGDVLECGEHRYTITEVSPLWLPEINAEQAVRSGVESGISRTEMVYVHYESSFKRLWQAHHKAPWESWVWALGLEASQ